MSQKNTKTAAKSTGAAALAKHKHPNAAHPPRHSDNPGVQTLAANLGNSQAAIKAKAGK